MARIFYWPDGSIYGVHPEAHEANPKIRLPAGVAWIDVPQLPHAINWPSVGGETGSEYTTRVVGNALQVKPGAVAGKRARLSEMLTSHGLTIADLKAELDNTSSAAPGAK